MNYIFNNDFNPQFLMIPWETAKKGQSIRIDLTETGENGLDIVIENAKKSGVNVISIIYPNYAILYVTSVNEAKQGMKLKIYEKICETEKGITEHQLKMIFRFKDESIRSILDELLRINAIYEEKIFPKRGRPFIVFKMKK